MKTKDTKTTSSVKSNTSFISPKNSGGFFVQTKLAVGQPEDKYEQEADRVADRVMKKTALDKPFFAASTPVVKKNNIADTNTALVQKAEEEEAQPKLIQLAEEEEAQTKRDIQWQEEEEEVAQTKLEVQRQAEEEEEAQPKLEIQRQEEEEEAVQAKTEKVNTSSSVLKAAHAGFTGSAGNFPFFDRIQTSFGKHDISGIQAYHDFNAVRSNQKMGSLAYASGNKVAFRNSPSLHTAAHEAAHVVQQRKGVSLKGGIGTKNDAYEQHANAVADRVVQRKGAQDLLTNMPRSSTQNQGTPLQFVQVSAGSEWLGNFWDLYVYPGHAASPGAGSPSTGRQVRSFQRLNNRSVSQEGGQQIVNVTDRGISGSQTLNDSEQIQQPQLSGPREWNLDLTTHELFDPQPVLADVIQNAIGDCYLLATLQGMASRGGGRTKLVNAVNEVGNGYSVEFFRIKVVGTQALVDPNSKIRVSIGRQHNPDGVTLREKNSVMADAQARELIQNSSYASQLQPGDTFNVNWKKRIVWPWAIERAYASVAGGFNRIEGGFSALPMMALTGEMPHHIFDFAALNAAQMGILLNNLNTLVDNDSIITSWTYDTLSNIYSSGFTVHSADRNTGVRLTGNDGVTTPVIPWSEITRFISSYIVLDPLGPVNNRSTFTTNADYISKKQGILEMVGRSGVVIIGTLSTVCLGQGLLLAPAHIYSITSVSNAGAQTSNPWAILHPGLVTPAQLIRAFGRLTFKP